MVFVDLRHTIEYGYAMAEFKTSSEVGYFSLTWLMFMCVEDISECNFSRVSCVHCCDIGLAFCNCV